MKEKQERLSLRIEPEIKAIIKEASDILGQSLSDFVINAAYEKANSITLHYSELKEFKDSK